MLVQTLSFITRWSAILAACWILLSVGETAVAQHHGHGQYCAEGQCIPSRTTFGFHPTRWLRWPTDTELEDAKAELQQRSPEGVPQYEVPDAQDESKRYPGLQPKPIVDEPEDATEDTRANPFTDDPAVPAFDHSTQYPTAGAKASLTDDGEFGPHLPFGKYRGDTAARSEVDRSVQPASAAEPIDKPLTYKDRSRTGNPLRGGLSKTGVAPHDPSVAELSSNWTSRRNPLRAN